MPEVVSDSPYDFKKMLKSCSQGILHGLPISVIMKILVRVEFLGTDRSWLWAPMQKLFGVAQLEKARSCASSIKKHDELKSFSRFRYQEIRGFLNSKHAVSTHEVSAKSKPISW